MSFKAGAAFCIQVSLHKLRSTSLVDVVNYHVITYVVRADKWVTHAEIILPFSRESSALRQKVDRSGIRRAGGFHGLPQSTSIEFSRKTEQTEVTGNIGKAIRS